jgi:hypothetical protein
MEFLAAQALRHRTLLMPYDTVPLVFDHVPLIRPPFRIPPIDGSLATCVESRGLDNEALAH